jgi:hypothetical protein
MSLRTTSVPFDVSGPSSVERWDGSVVKDKLAVSTKSSLNQV